MREEEGEGWGEGREGLTGFLAAGTYSVPLNKAHWAWLDSALDGLPPLGGCHRHRMGLEEDSCCCMKKAHYRTTDDTKLLVWVIES